MATVYMMIGIPGSGKSTYAQTHLAGKYYVSPDKIRKKLYGDISVQGDAKEVFDLVDKELKHTLSCGANVVYDATNTAFRSKQIEKFRKMGADKVIGYYMNTPFSVCMERNLNRTDRSVPVPDSIMYKMEEKMERFKFQLFSEDFDELVIVNNK